MAVTPWLYPGTAANVARAGSGVSWTSPEAIEAEADKTSPITINNNYSDWLRATDFGFDVYIAAGIAITGIEIRIRRYGASGGTMTIDSMRLLDSTSSVTGDDKTDTWENANNTETYGSSTDDWNWTGDATDVRSVNFGVQLSMACTAGATIQINYIQMRIHYDRALEISIAGTDRASYVPIDSIEIDNVLTRQIDTARFRVEDGSGLSLQELQEVGLYRDVGGAREL